jgi:hypothetical protein
MPVRRLADAAGFYTRRSACARRAVKRELRRPGAVGAANLFGRFD